MTPPPVPLMKTILITGDGIEKMDKLFKIWLGLMAKEQVVG